MRRADSRRCRASKKKGAAHATPPWRICRLAGLALPLSLYFLIFCISIHAVPFIHLLLSFVLRDPISFLDPAYQLILLSLNDVEIVVGQLAPARLKRTFHLFPLAFHSVVIHE